MKVVILAGGLGTRISEESITKPKPMIEIGCFPIIWHIMKIYSHYGFNEFIICAGYKQEYIRQWFMNYPMLMNDFTIDFSTKNTITYHTQNTEPWKVTIVDTGLHTMTGGRIKRIQSYIGEEPFMLTYGDGVSDVNLSELVKFHTMQKTLATLTAVKPQGRFGELDISGNLVDSFREKNSNDVHWINGGFMILEPEIFHFLDGDSCILERTPLETLSKQNNLSCYRHYGFWACMDTMNDKLKLNHLWDTDKAPWKTW